MDQAQSRVYLVAGDQAWKSMLVGAWVKESSSEEKRIEMHS
jgi:hypothetical protein